jgi:hypothetical protein
MQDTTLFFSMPDPVAEQALVNACAITRRVPIPFIPEASFVVLVGAVFPPIGEVIEPCIKHGLQDVRGYQGIIKDARLKSSKGISAGQGT